MLLLDDTLNVGQWVNIVVVHSDARYIDATCLENAWFVMFDILYYEWIFTSQHHRDIEELITLMLRL